MELKNYQVWVGMEGNPEAHDFYVQAPNIEEARQIALDFAGDRDGWFVSRVEEFNE